MPALAASPQLISLRRSQENGSSRLGPISCPYREGWTAVGLVAGDSVNLVQKLPAGAETADVLGKGIDDRPEARRRGAMGRDMEVRHVP